MQLILSTLVFTILMFGLSVQAEPPVLQAKDSYYHNMKTCTPAVYQYDALKMGLKNTNRIVGKENGKCVFNEEINPVSTIVCRVPMHMIGKYAEENIKMLKGDYNSEFVKKINTDVKYCSIETRE